MHTQDDIDELEERVDELSEQVRAVQLVIDAAERLLRDDDDFNSYVTNAIEALNDAERVLHMQHEEAQAELEEAEEAEAEAVEA